MHHHQHDAGSDDAREAAAIGTALPGAVVTAIVSAVYHATSKRIRDLAVTVAKLP